VNQPIITIVGSYNVDLMMTGKRLPKVGETVTADGFLIGAGGKGSNQAIAATRYGANIRFIGRVGADNYGKEALDLFRRVGISTEWITIDSSTPTGVSFILIDKKGKNMISVAHGANLHLSREDLDRALPTIKGSFITGFQLENNLEMVFYGIRRAHETGCLTFLDPAPAAKIPMEIYPCIDIIKPNETEAQFLTGREVKSPSDAEAAGAWFLDHGVGKVIVTLGEQGAVLVSPNQVRHFPAPQVHAIDSTGAGDIFSGSFLSAFSSGKSIEEAIQFAIIAATLSTKRFGVSGSIPDLEMVNRRMENFGGSTRSPDK